MGDKIQVEVPAIDAFSKTSDKRGERFDAIMKTLEEAKVGRESFGKMPSSGDIFAQYEERVSASMDDLKECAEGMRDISESLQHTIQDYRGVDGGVANIMKQVMETMSGINIPQVGK